MEFKAAIELELTANQNYLSVISGDQSDIL
jgi:hypothetical protein